MDENVSNNSAGAGTSHCPDGCQCLNNCMVREGGGGPRCHNALTSSLCPTMNVNVYPTTGGQFQVRVNCSDTTEQLKKSISKKLKVAKERICLLHKEKELRDGSLKENGVQEGSSITLLPMVETGLFTQKPEQSVLQALESLSDIQVNDFLSGKSPLNLAMRLGDHMMFIQLQLSTVGTSLTRTKSLPNAPRQGPSRSSATAAPTPALPRQPSQIPTSTPGGVAPSSSKTGATVPCSHRSPGSRPCLSKNTASSSACPDHRQPPRRHLTDVTHLLDTRTLAEASRNLSQTLRHLSSQALSSSRAETEENPQNYRSQGAIIESMHHHGRGVFSGTFSGTLNPALQDRHGHPKRDISTIVHILNDLLEATPQYRRQNGGGAESSAARPQGPRVAGTGRAIDNTTKEYSRLSLENEATRGKMEQLQLMLEERRARRRVRRVLHAPYPTTWSVPADGTAVVSATAGPAPLESGVVDTLIGETDKIKTDGGSMSPASDAPMDCDPLADDAMEGESATTANEYLKLNPETVVA